MSTKCWERGRLGGGAEGISHTQWLGGGEEGISFTHWLGGGEEGISHTHWLGGGEEGISHTHWLGGGEEGISHTHRLVRRGHTCQIRRLKLYLQLLHGSAKQRVQHLNLLSKMYIPQKLHSVGIHHSLHVASRLILTAVHM